MFGLFKTKLPDCNSLFEKFISPWYEEDDELEIVRPDMYQIAAYEGKPLQLDYIQYLDDDYLQYQKKHINDTMLQAVMEDYQTIIEFEKLDLSVLDAVDKYYDRKRISALIKESDPTDFSNPYLVAVCEFGSMLGHLFKQKEGFDWLYSHPYFRSIIVHSETGFGITVFDWAVKKFSEYGVDDGFVEKFHAVLDGVNGRFEDQDE
jgi:hypothetical protein